MKSILTAGFTALVAIFFIASCHKSDNPGPDDPDDPTKPIEYVTVSITGRVIDDNNQPVNGAVVKAGTASTTTDIDGNFRINNVSLNKDAGLVKIQKEGFFETSRTIVIKSDVVNFISLQLIKKSLSGTVSGSSGGSITVQGGGSVAFTGNSFVNTTGNSAYTGTVSVSTYFLNPTASNFAEIMPGTLRGINAANKETGLKCFGILAVELAGAGGEQLQLAPGKTATVTIPIPTGLQAKAPATIPLWSFNDTTGLWKEEGVATKQGANYVGTVSHFSCWNFSSSYSMIDIKAVIKDINLVPLYPVRVEFRGTDSTLYSYGYTDSTGLISCQIPSGEALQLRIVFNKCMIGIWQQDIGPFNTANDLGTIKIDYKYISTVVISGSVINCNAQPVTNGFADISLDNTYYRTTITNGNFSMNITRCTVGPATASITAYDLGANKMGMAANVAVSPPTVNVGTISACSDSIGSWFNFTVNGINVSYIYPADSLVGYASATDNYFSVYGFRRHIGSNPSTNMANLQFTATGRGPVPLRVAYISEAPWQYLCRIGGQHGNVNVTEYGAPGGYVSGNFTGQILRHPDYSDSLLVPVTITFRVKRQY